MWSAVRISLGAEPSTVRTERNESGRKGTLQTNQANTTLAEWVFAAVFQGFAFGNMGTAGAAAEG
jgi:hypothetical protein